MLVVMHSHATPEQIEQVLDRHPRHEPDAAPACPARRAPPSASPATSAPSIRALLEVLPGVLELIRVTKPYKLASREMHEADTYVRLPQTVIGPGTFTIIAGPCSVENEDDDPAHRRVPARAAASG